MFSGEKEEIQFANPVDPKDKQVEYWMGEVEQMMYDSIRKVLETSINDYSRAGRGKWVQVHSG
jgi:hypothetical protein